ncbi:MAG: chromosome segregation protein SMC [Clostridia bacterium]|nr:chromosome segregation protein SMC [Clostridia bacterium]
MYLKALEIQGFKSFAEKTRLTFDRDVTAIVGPNGSGKSNISDAILWVMGEQSTKTLRGGKMQDVIFSGTETRGSMGIAEVSLILDNSAGILGNISEEVTITRKYYRSGESEYYINREAVRLRDVNELLMDTGLGRDGYSIIGQGRIAEIVSGKSEERREVLEEAAGISRYRYRKEESERKLKRTDENLIRINDKIDELEYQVGPLREQAETAKRYLQLRDELREEEVSLWMQTLDKLHEQAESVKRDFDAARSGLETAKKDLEALYARSEDLARIMREKDVQTEEMRIRLTKTEAAAAECEAAAAVLRANMKNSAERIEQLKEQIAGQEEREREIAGQIEARRARTAEIDERAKELDKAESSAQNVIEGHRLRISNRDAEAARVNDALTKQIVELRSSDSRIAMLTEMEKEYEGFGKAVKTVMREARHGALRGVGGTVAELIKADERCALAIETALGGAIQNIVVDTQNDGRAAIELLKRRDCGRGTFLPLDTMRGGRLDSIPDEDEGCVGLAVDLVAFDSKYRNVIENLLGRTLVAETLTDAMAISRKNGGRLRIVTLDGQLIHAGGSMTGGSAAKGTGILSRANELEKLQAARAGISEKCDALAAEADKLKRELSAGRYELEMASEDLQAVRNEKASLAAERRANENSAAELELLRRSISGDVDSRAGAARDIETGTDSFRKLLEEKESRIAELDAAAEKLRADIAAMTAKKLEVEGQRTRADKELQEKNAALLDMERACARFEQKKLASEMEEKQIIDKLWDGYGLSHSAAEAVRRPIESVAQANRRIGEQKRAMAALGNPNLGAIDEYARVSERYEFLTSQRDDIEKARRELLGIIADITSEMKAIFTKEFTNINESFVQTFTELFGGGRAELVLEDPESVLDCGIDIRVQPPGKALATLSLLSGGEMAFVAIALYFAIMKVRPTPFCVMDEIEAALDDSNVIRFAEYLRNISDKTQFIVITHRRATMEGADDLYGVTMQQKGVSKVIELDLAEAEKHIEEEN